MYSIDPFFLVSGFIAVVLALEGAYLAWSGRHGPEALRLQRRLRAMAAGEHGRGAEALLKRRLPAGLGGLDRLLLHLPRVAALERLLLQAGSNRPLSHFLLVSVLAFLSALLLARLLHLPAGLGLGLALGAGTLPALRLLMARRRRLRQLEQQLPDVLDLMARALRAGHAFSAALGMVGSEAAEPIAGEFRTTFDEINFGVPLADALANLGTRVPSPDLGYFVIAVLLQRETGGNLAELLGNLSSLMRARFKLLGSVRALSAEGRLSAWILALLPFAVAGVLNVINPRLMQILWTDPLGWSLVQAALLLMAIGVLWMWRMVRIRV